MLHLQTCILRRNNHSEICLQEHEQTPKEEHGRRQDIVGHIDQMIQTKDIDYQVDIEKLNMLSVILDVNL